jgi:hypothetical protein
MSGQQWWIRRRALKRMVRDAEDAGLYDQPEAVTAEMPGGSGAGSTVDRLPIIASCMEGIHRGQDEPLFPGDIDWLIAEVRQSRATEAELRAALRILLGECCAVGRGRCENTCHIQAWGALDATEQPAPPETAPRVRSANASVSDDLGDLETAEGAAVSDSERLMLKELA